MLEIGQIGIDYVAVPAVAQLGKPMLDLWPRGYTRADPTLGARANCGLNVCCGVDDRTLHMRRAMAQLIREARETAQALGNERARRGISDRH